MRNVFENLEVLIQRSFCGALAAVFVISTVGSSDAQTFDSIVLTGDSSPDGNGIFPTLDDSFSVPVLNNKGQVFFTGSLFNSTNGSTDDTGIFRGTIGGLEVQVRENQLTPNQLGATANTFSDLKTRRLSPNDNGQTAFQSTIRGGSSGDAGVFRADSSGVTKIVRGGDPAPLPIGNFQSGNFTESPVINDLGEVAFFGRLFGTFGGNNDDWGGFSGDGNSIKQIFREGQSAPDGSGTLEDGFTALKINNSGQVVTRIDLSNANDGSVLLGDGVSLSEPARIGDAAPNQQGIQNGTFRAFSEVSLNDSGQLAFWAVLNSTAPSNSDFGVYRTDGSQTVEIFREDQVAADQNGQISTVYAPLLNNQGDVATYVEYEFTDGGTADDGAILRWSDGQLEQIARERDAAPNGGKFSRFEALDTFSVALNERSSVAFLAELDLEDGGTTIDSEGLFLYQDGVGITEIVREGDLLFGSTVTEISFDNNLSGFTDASGLNNRDQVVFRFELANSFGGIALWTPDFSGNSLDLDLFQGQIGLASDDPDFNPMLDLNNDGTITLADYDLAAPTLIGDLNLDGDVDVTQIQFSGPSNVGDASTLLANLGVQFGAVYANGDLNADGDVDVSEIRFVNGNVVNVGDAARLLSKLGSVNSGAASPSAVPEPSSLVLVSLLGILAASQRRKAVPFQSCES